MTQTFDSYVIVGRTNAEQSNLDLFTCRPHIDADVGLSLQKQILSLVHCTLKVGFLHRVRGVASDERKATVEHCRRWQIAAPQHVELPLPLGPLFSELL
jgi:hypothetical protein